MTHNTVKLSIYDNILTALIDSGSVLTAISLDTFRDLSNKHTISMGPSFYSKVCLADGQYTIILGEVQLPLTIANVKFIFTLHVIEHLCFPVIIGLDFLQKYAHSINFSENQLILSDITNIDINKQHVMSSICAITQWRSDAIKFSNEEEQNKPKVSKTKAEVKSLKSLAQSAASEQQLRDSSKQ